MSVNLTSAATIRYATVTVFSILISACGGGGGGGSAGNAGSAATGGSNGQNIHSVSATAGPGGIVNPGARNVTEGATTTINISADSGYEIVSVTGCGGTLTGDVYTTGAVTGACSISAVFQPIRVQVSAATGSTGGALAPAVFDTTYGEVAYFAVTPEPGFRIAGASGCDGSLVGSIYTTGQLTDSCDITATFEAKPQTIAPVELAHRRPDQEVRDLEYILNGLLNCSSPGTCIWRWNYADPIGSAATVKYSFAGAANGYPNLPSLEYREFRDAEKTAIEDVLHRISEVTFLEFVETDDIYAADSINFVITVGAGGRAGAPPKDSSSAQFPQVVQLGTITLNRLTPEAGQWAWDEMHDIASAKAVIAHEIGHIMGIKHPGNYFGESYPTLSDTEENQFYSAVSYNANGGGAHLTLQADTYQKYDIVALQFLYGIRPQSGSATVYTFDDEYDSRPVVHDLTEMGALDISGSSGDSIMDLGPGAFSSFGVNIVDYAVDTYGAYQNRPYNNLTTTYGTQLREGRVGGGNDVVYDNALDNTLVLGNGNDIVFLSGGSNIVDGGGGMDMARFASARADFRVESTIGAVLVEHLLSGRVDTLSSVEFLVFDSVPYLTSDLCLCSN